MKAFIIFIIGLAFPWVFWWGFLSFLHWELQTFGDWSLQGRLTFFFICIIMNMFLLPLIIAIMEDLKREEGNG